MDAAYAGYPTDWNRILAQPSASVKDTEVRAIVAAVVAHSNEGIGAVKRYLEDKCGLGALAYGHIKMVACAMATSSHWFSLDGYGDDNGAFGGISSFDEDEQRRKRSRTSF